MTDSKALVPVTSGALFLKSSESVAPRHASLVENVYSYLTNARWQKLPSGPVGALWKPPANLGGVSMVAVPNRLRPESLEWRGIVERVAAVERRSKSDVAQRILTQYVDVLRLRATGTSSLERAIQLDAGAVLIQSAYEMLRAAGTTARRPRAQIGGNYSPLGDDVVRNARMGHTEEGSYVIPVWIPLTPPEAEDGGDVAPPSLQGMEIERMPLETTERRVTRTLAQSLAAVRQVIVEPERAPTKAADLIPVVTAGGSRELVRSLHRFLSLPSVTSLNAQFSWAGGLAAPGGVVEGVSIEAESAPLLEEAAKLLRVAVKFPRQIYTGQIVMITHRPGEKFGEISIDTVRQSRSCEIRIRLDRETLDLAHDWARSERAVLVEGTVVRGGPGRLLRIEELRRIIPLDETFLPGTDV